MESNRIRINIESLLILFIYIAVFTNSASAILYRLANTSESWGDIISYARLLIVMLNIVFIILHYLRRRVVYHKYILSVYLYLFYVIIVTFLFFRPSAIHFITNVFAWPLTFVSFYLYSERSELTPFFKKVFLLTNVAICLLLFRTIQTRDLIGTNVGTVYYGVACLPMILAICKRKEKIIFSVIITILTLLSSKRAGVITLLIGFSGYIICNVGQTQSIKKKLRRIVGLVILACIATYFVAYYIDNYNSTIMARLKSISVDQGSGRLLIWDQIINAFHNSSTINKILGHGYHAVPFEINPFGNHIYAHNSFLETLYDLGIVGLAWMIAMIVYMIVVMIQLIRNKEKFAPSSIFAIVILMVFSLVSYFFDESGTIMHIACFWGIVQGVYSRNNLKSRGYLNEVKNSIDM